MRYLTQVLRVAVVAGIAASCGGEAADSDERDLGLVTADSTIAPGDVPDEAGGAAPAPAATPAPQRPRPRPQPPTLAEGASFTVYSVDTLTSRHNEAGQQIWAVAVDPILDASGREVIPDGALLSGTITDIAPAESPGGEGRLSLQLTQVEIDGVSYAVMGVIDSLGTRMKGRGITAGDAAKVGAGAVVGAVAGRIIGGNRTGTIVGAAAGAAAGVGIAAATRDIDIILDAGAPIFVTLTAAFTRP